MEKVPKQRGKKCSCQDTSLESSIVESSVSTSSAFYQYCLLDFSVVHGRTNDIDKKHCLWSVAKNWN